MMLREYIDFLNSHPEDFDKQFGSEPIPFEAKQGDLTIHADNTNKISIYLVECEGVDENQEEMFA